MPLDDGDTLARAGEPMRERRAGLAGADDDGVEFRHGTSLARTKDGHARFLLRPGFEWTACRQANALLQVAKMPVGPDFHAQRLALPDVARNSSNGRHGRLEVQQTRSK